MHPPHADPLEHLPPPPAIRRMIADYVRRTELLRKLLRVSLHREQLLGEKAGAVGEEVARVAR